MALYVGDNEISQKILLKGNVGVQLPTMSSDTEGQYLSNDGIQSVWKDEQIGYKQISNCITEIPQDIKLELNSDHTITLKAGSKLYIPNGFETNGITKKFDTITTNIDISLNADVSFTNMFIFYVDNHLERIRVQQVYSGTTAPIGDSYMFWYDTTLNKIKRTSDSGTTWTENINSFPLGLVTSNNSLFISIDQVFNGFGYIGKKAFILPGVSGLQAFGVNSLGKFKSISTKENIVQICDLGSVTGNYDWTFFHTLSSTGINDYRNSIKHYEQDYTPISLSETTATWYNTKDNYLYYTSDTGATWVRSNYIPLFTYTLDSNGVTNFKPKQPIKLVTRNDSHWISYQSMPSKKAIPLTLGASGTTYTAPANGYFSIDGQGPNWVDVAIINTGLNYGYCYASRSSDNYVRTLIPVSKGNKCQILFDTAFTNLISFNFIYAEGEL